MAVSMISFDFRFFALDFVCFLLLIGVGGIGSSLVMAELGYSD